MTQHTEGRFDHLLLAKGYPLEVERFLAFAARSRDLGVALAELFILHEADGSCCKAQPWLETLVGLLEQLLARFRKGAP